MIGYCKTIHLTKAIQVEISNPKNYFCQFLDKILKITQHQSFQRLRMIPNKALNLSIITQIIQF
jgi:hypothetical protein